MKSIVTARTPYNIRKIATRVIVEGADVAEHVQHSQDNIWWTKRSWVGAGKWAVTEPT